MQTSEQTEEAPATETAVKAPDTAAPVAEEPTTEAATKEPDKTIIDEAGSPTAEPPVVPTDIPDDWREQMAGDDKALLAMLKRIKSYKDLGKKLSSQEQTIRSAKHKQPLPDDATEEQVAEYRKANNIPEEPAGYLEHLQGLVVGDADLPMIQDFLESAHKTNASPEFVSQAVNWYYDNQAKLVAQRAEEDREYKLESQAQLHDAMGPDFLPNMRDLRNWLSSEEGLFDSLMSARLNDGNGRLLGDDTQIINFLVNAMREINPAHSVVPGMSGDSAERGIQSEIESFESMLRTQDGQHKYWGDPKLQNRYNELLSARERLERRKVA